MKLSKAFVVFPILLLFVSTTALYQAEQPHEIILMRHINRFEQFRQEVVTSKLLSQKLDKKSLSAFKIQLLKTRMAYKRCEYLWEYADAQFIKEFINGAPLPKLEKNSFGLNVLQPKGLQVLDELVFSEEALNEKNNITEQLTQLEKSLTNYPNTLKVYDRQVWEGMRLELVRLVSLGITGFDVPGSLNTVAECSTVVNTLYEDYLLYDISLRGKNTLLAQDIQLQFLSLIQEFNHAKSFEKIDRWSVTKTINALHGKLNEAQSVLSIERADETMAEIMLPPVNMRSTGIFQEDFLDVFKYIGLPKVLHSEAVVELGKMLFYDPILSQDNQRACSGCHNPQLAFTDGKAKSIATGNNGTVNRNSPTLINAVYSERFFHDLRADALEDQMEHVVTSEKEFNTTIYEIAEKLNQSSEYKNRFSDCFPAYSTNPINKHTLAFAISAYVSSLKGFNSPFDHYMRGENKEPDAAIKKGYNLFMGKAACGTCHFAPVFNGSVPPLYNESESEVLGVPENPYASNLTLDKDPGRMAAKLKEGADFYQYSFKTPTVRNIALTAPYMHNGAYKTLEDVMDFYNKGGGLGLGLVVPHQTLSEQPLNLSKKEIADIISFMKALTDTTRMTSQPMYLPQFNNHPEWNKRKMGGNY